MGSSNRHWPSMFKTKSCNQWQQQSCHSSPAHHKSADEKSIEPKPRWNPKPEQVKILEGIFNSGMVNPPRDEIPRIRLQLQQFGQVGDANVFYWFQNRKSRSKQKLRRLPVFKNHHMRSITSAIAAAAPMMSSSSSSDRSSDKMTALLPVSASPTASVNKTYFQSPAQDPLLFDLPVPVPPPPVNPPVTTLGSEQHWEEAFLPWEFCKGGQDDTARVTGELHHGYNLHYPPPSFPAAAPPPNPLNEIIQFQGLMMRSTVFINDVAVEAPPVPIDVKKIFGNEAVLFNSSGNPVPTDELGLTLQPLQNGASYYLLPFPL